VKQFSHLKPDKGASLAGILDGLHGAVNIDALSVLVDQALPHSGVQGTNEIGTLNVYKGASRADTLPFIPVHESSFFFFFFFFFFFSLSLVLSCSSIQSSLL
jgi:hypothetical protein